MIPIKTRQDISKLREAGIITARILKQAAQEVKAGVTTKEIDRLVGELVKSNGVKAAFKGYHGYPANICISVNEEVVHGIPGDRELKDGDIVSLDFGAVKDGFFSDIAVTVPVGKISKDDERLLTVTREALEKGIEMAVPGNRLYDISYAIQKHVEKNSYSVVRHFVGHGIGRMLHEEPQIPNYGKSGCGPKLQSGMVFAIEPMVNAGGYDVTIKGDGWTAVTADGSRSAHFEHCVAITDEGPVVLTLDTERLNA